jgi:alkylation response protein AidB-like acyl-CoA dehydrogenase
MREARAPRLTGGGWVINGAKTFTTNGHYADVCVAMAVTDREKRHHGISAFIVEKKRRDFVPAKKKTSWACAPATPPKWSSATAACPRKTCWAPKGTASSTACKFSTADAFPLPRWRWEWRRALRRGHEIRQGTQAVRQAIAEFQAIQFKLADMATGIARRACWCIRRRGWPIRAAAGHDGVRFTRESSMAKLYASEVAVRVANEAVQIFGGYGFIKDYPAEKFYRDVKLCTIGEGTSEIQRLVIARQLLGKH